MTILDRAPRTTVEPGTPPEPLRILLVCAPDATDVAQAIDAAEDPPFVLHLSRPLTHLERCVVRADLPTATLNGDDDPVLTIALSPHRMQQQPAGLPDIVTGISTAAVALRKAIAAKVVDTMRAAELVNELCPPRR